MRYRDAGVDIARADAVKDAIGRAVRSTWRDGVVPLAGGFAGLMAFPGAPGLLAATLDGVGSKMQLAIAAGRVDEAAADLVYHGANDLLVHGARPLAFLDYIAQSRLDPAVVVAAVEGLARACREVGAVLLGGETAEMPDTYREGTADVAGCMLGIADPAHVIDGTMVEPGDAVLGIAGSGLHTNGYTLARRIVAASALSLDAPLPGGDGERVGDALLRPHRWYGPSVMPLVNTGRLHALAHVTGGGIAGNLARVLPIGCRARVGARAWPRPALFRWLMEAGEVPEDDARGAFNLGVGMVAVVARAEAEEVTRSLTGSGETVWRIGEVVAGPRGVEWMER